MESVTRSEPTTATPSAPAASEDGARVSPVLPESKPSRPRWLILPILLFVGILYAVLRLGLGQPEESFLHGTLEVQEVAIASEVPGKVASVSVDEGQTVRREQVLVRLDDSALQVQYRQAGPTERQLLDVQLDRLQLRSPIDGIVVRRSIQPGEVVAAGMKLLTVADLTTLDLTLYVHERELPFVSVGQHVRLVTDAYPGRTFEAIVSSISTRAEFTPRNIETRQDRVNLVFAVHVKVPNRDGALRPGLPVDARLD